MSGVAAALLPVLLVLTPLLLLLDTVEPGFVRSVMNPFWFVVALVVVAVLVPQGDAAAGISRRTVAVLAGATALLVGAWVWWDLHAGLLGLIVALLAAVAVGSVIVSVSRGEGECKE